MSDLIRRTVWTFIEAFLGVFIANGLLDLGIDVVEKAAVAGLAAAATVVLVYARQQLDRPIHIP